MKESNQAIAYSAPSRKQLAYAVASILMLAASQSGHAQQQQSTAAAGGEPEEIIVTGIRKGIEDAITVKQESDLIIEAVSAEDIGELPDMSIVDSVARLPGVAAQRDQ